MGEEETKDEDARPLNQEEQAGPPKYGLKPVLDSGEVAPGLHAALCRLQAIDDPMFGQLLLQRDAL